MDAHHLAVLTSRARDFDPDAPEGTLDEIAQWFRRHPHLYQSVTPKCLEQLVASVFAGLHSYVDGIHVGRPGDDGVDVVLVEGDGRSWLVQVKRRETPTASEGVGTIRHLLGSMLLAGSRFGAVVPSADHYTYYAHRAAGARGGHGGIWRVSQPVWRAMSLSGPLDSPSIYRMRFMTWFVRIAGVYNASAIVVFLTPGAPEAVGLQMPGIPFWVWLPSLVGLFAGIVLVLSSMDLRRFGAFPYWNGIVRLIFVVAVFALDLPERAGAFVTVLAIGDVPLALVTIFGLPFVLRRSHADLLRNRMHPIGSAT